MLRKFIYIFPAFFLLISCTRTSNTVSVQSEIFIDQELISMAEQNDAIAQYTLGMNFYLGEQGFLLDKVKGIEWITKAAENGLDNAQYSLGDFYSKGENVKKDHRQAAIWFWKSALQGHAEAIYRLGLQYFHGDGINMDYIKSYAWLSLITNRDTRAINLVNDISQKLTAEQIAEAGKIASKIRSEL